MQIKTNDIERIKEVIEELGTAMYPRRKNFFIAKIVDKFTLGE